MKIKPLFLFFTLLMTSHVIAVEPVQEAIDIRVDGQQESISTQASIDTLVDETRDMFQEYEQATIQLSDLKIYNEQLSKLVAKQQSELDSFEQELLNAQETNRSIVPMMLNMLKVLERFVKLDTPFLADERKLRLSALKNMMDDPDVTLTEKFRRILEAYQIEADYGRTIEAYNGDISLESETLAVEFLRLGRVALYFTTFDGSRLGIWNNESGSWDTLPANFRDSIDTGLKIARKQAPPDLIQLPLMKGLQISHNEMTGGEQ